MHATPHSTPHRSCDPTHATHRARGRRTPTTSLVLPSQLSPTWSAIADNAGRCTTQLKRDQSVPAGVRVQRVHHPHRSFACLHRPRLCARGAVTRAPLAEAEQQSSRRELAPAPAQRRTQRRRRPPPAAARGLPCSPHPPYVSITLCGPTPGPPPLRAPLARTPQSPRSPAALPSRARNTASVGGRRKSRACSEGEAKSPLNLPQSPLTPLAARYASSTRSSNCRPTLTPRCHAPRRL